MPAIGSLLHKCLLIALWWTTNVGTVIANKYMFKVLRLPCPMLLVTVHLALGSMGCVLLVDWVQVVPKVRLRRSLFLRRLLPLVLVFSASLVLGNTSLRYVPVSFMQTIKGFVPVSTVLLQWLVFRRVFPTPLYLALLPIVVGVVLTTLTELTFVMTGFLAAAIDCFMTSAKIILQEVLMKEGQKLSSFSLMYYMTPLSATVILPFGLFFEFSTLHAYFSDPANPRAQAAGLAISGAVVAFAFNLCTFTVVRSTSALTANVLGNLKTAVTILVSWMLFRNPMAALNVLGCTITVLGVTGYGLVAQLTTAAPEASGQDRVITLAGKGAKEHEMDEERPGAELLPLLGSNGKDVAVVRMTVSDKTLTGS